MKGPSSKRQNMWVAPKRDWTPFDLPYLIGWNSNRFLQNFTVSDNALSNWQDSSQNGNNITSPPSGGAASERPNIATSSNFGGRKVAVFVGSDDKTLIQETPPAALSIGLGDFFFATACFLNTAGGTQVLFSGQKNGTTSELRVDVTASGEPRFRLSSTAQVTGASSIFDSTTLVVATRIGGTVSLFINGVSVGTPVSGTSVDINTSVATRFASMNLGAKGISGFVDGEIAEFIYGGAGSITDFDRQRLEGYLAHEVGISSVLPTTHPYKYGPPKKAT